MGYPTENTEWPSTKIPESVKNLLDGLFQLLDANPSDIGKRVSEDFFTPNGAMVVNKKVFQGKAEVAKSREGKGKGVKSRRHTVQKVYAFDDAASDLLFIGAVDMTFNNGGKMDGTFCVRVIIDDPNLEHPRLKLYQGWMDPTELQDALAQQTE